VNRNFVTHYRNPAKTEPSSAISSTWEHIDLKERAGWIGDRLPSGSHGGLTSTAPSIQLDSFDNRENRA
jgi:hypothetical protein